MYLLVAVKEEGLLLPPDGCCIFFFLKFTPQSCIWHVVFFLHLCRCCWIKSHWGKKTEEQECLLHGWAVVGGGGGRDRPRFGGILQIKKNVKLRNKMKKKKDSSTLRSFCHLFTSSNRPTRPSGFITQRVCSGERYLINNSFFFSSLALANVTVFLRLPLVVQTKSAVQCSKTGVGPELEWESYRKHGMLLCCCPKETTFTTASTTTTTNTTRSWLPCWFAFVFAEERRTPQLRGRDVF